MRTTPVDLYAVLGLTPSATPAQLRRAYRALLRQHHPDTRGAGPRRGGDAANQTNEAAQAVQLVLTAYEVLRDPARRAAYDRLRTSSGSAIPVRVRVHQAPTTPDTPPIQAGPVRWHT
jgi:curved DNA-binding protein CbpA